MSGALTFQNCDIQQPQGVYYRGQFVGINRYKAPKNEGEFQTYIFTLPTNRHEPTTLLEKAFYHKSATGPRIRLHQKLKRLLAKLEKVHEPDEIIRCWKR